MRRPKGSTVFVRGRYLDTPTPQTGRFSCISRFEYRGKIYHVEEKNSGEKITLGYEAEVDGLRCLV